MNEQKWFMHRIRVRYQETDQMGVVYHPNYLTWFEIGRTEWIRQKGFSYRQLEEEGLKLPVTDIQMKYVKPAKYDDTIMIYTRLAELSSVRVTFKVEVRRQAPEQLSTSGDAGRQELFYDQPAGELLVSGTTRHAWLGSTWKPVRLERDYPHIFNMLRLAEQVKDESTLGG